MNKIKVIDLLNMISKGEEVPKKIKYEKDTYIHIDNYCYYCEDTNLILSDRIFAEYSKLNDEVEILEETKKIEKIDFGTLNTQKEKNRAMKDTINKLIDEMNNLKENKYE